MERAWSVIRTAGGVLLLIELLIFLAGSAHAGHLLNSREFGLAFDHVTGSVVHEARGAVHWVTARGR